MISVDGLKSLFKKARASHDLKKSAPKHCHCVKFFNVHVPHHTAYHYQLCLFVLIIPELIKQQGTYFRLN